MTKDVDAISRYIDPLIKKYFVVFFIMPDNDIRKCPFAYNFDVFLNCSNSGHVKHTDLLLEDITVPNFPTPLVLYHTPVRFLYYVLIFIVDKPLLLFYVLSFHLKTLHGYLLTQLFIYFTLR